MDLVATLKLNADEYMRGIDQAAQGWDEFSSQIEESNRDWSAFASNLVSGGAALTAAITLPLAGVGTAALSMASDFEQAEIAFTTMLGSGEEAKKFLDELKAFAASTPFEFTDLQNAAKRLQALGFEATTVIPIMRTVGDAVAGLGGGAALIDRITLALGQMQAKGKVSAQEMNQLAEAGIPAWQALADKIGVSIPEAMKMAESGAISAAEAIPAILGGMAEKFGGLMEQQSQTVAGKFSNLKDQLSFILADLGKSLLPFANTVMEMAKPMLEAIQFLVDGFSSLPQPVQAGIVAFTALAAAAGPVLLAVGGIITALTSLAPLLGTAGIGATVAALGTAFGGVALAVAAVVAAFELWQLEPVQNAVRGLWEAVTGFWNETLKPFIDTILAGAQAFGTFAAGVISSGLAAAWEAISGAAEVLWGWLRQVWDALGELGEAFLSVLDSLSPLLQPLVDLAEFLGKVYLALVAGGLIVAWEALKAVLGFVGGLLIDLAEILGGALLVGLRGLSTLVGAIGEALSRTLKPALAFVIEQISDFIGWLQKIPGVKQAIEAVGGAFDNVKAAVTGVSSETKKFSDETDKADKATKNATNSASKYSGGLDAVRASLEKKTQATGASAEETRKLEAEHKKTETAITNTSNALQGILTHLDRSKGGVNDLVAAEHKLEDLQIKLNQQFGSDLPPSIKGMYLQVEIAKIKIQELREEAERLELEKLFEAASEAVQKHTENLKTFVKDSSDVIKLATDQALEALKTLPEGTEEIAGKVDETLGQVEQRTAESAEKQKSIWGSFTQQVSTIFSDFAKNVTERIWDAFSGKGNEELAKQRADLEASLAERTADWEKYQQDVAAQLEEITRTHAEKLEQEIADLNAALQGKRDAYAEYEADILSRIDESRQKHAEALDREVQDLIAKLEAKRRSYEEYASEVQDKLAEIQRVHAEKLAEEIADLQSNLADRREKYEQYAVDIADKIAKVRRTHAEKLAEEIDDLQGNLESKRRSYTQYVEDVTRKAQEIREQHAERLAEELKDLQENLESKAKAYKDFVADANKKLSRLGQDTEEQIDDETRETKRGIEDRKREYRRYEQDINARIERELAKGRDANQEQIRDWRRSLAEKREDLDVYIQRAEENLAEFTDDQKREQQRQEEDLKASIAAREAEYQRYVSEIQGQIVNVTQKHAEEEAAQLAELQVGLTRRTEEFNRYQQEIQEAMAEAVANHASQQAEEEAELIASLQRRKEEHEKFERETQEKIDAAINAHAQKQAKEEADLLASLERRRRELDAFEASTFDKIDEAVEKHRKRQEDEEADLLASLNRRRQELDKYEADIAAKIAAAIQKHADQQAAEETELQNSLNRRRQEYEQFKTDVSTKIGEILDAHKGFLESLGTLLTGTLNDIGQLVTRIATEKITGELAGALMDVFKKDGVIWKAIGGFFDFLGGLFSKTKDAIIGIGQEGVDQLARWGLGGTPSVPGAPGGGGGAPSTGGAAGAAGGGLAGAITAIGSAVTAISSVVGNFQMSGMNRTLDLIEKEVRYSQIHLSYILDRANAHLPKLDGMEEFNYNVVASGWFDLLSHLDNYMPRFATAFETDLPDDIWEVRTSIENTKGTIELLHEMMSEKLSGLVSGIGEKLATVATGFKSAVEASTSTLQSSLRDVVSSDLTSRSSITSALSMLGGDVRNVQLAINQANMAPAMLTELGNIRNELTQIKSLNQSSINAKPSQTIVNVQAPPNTSSPQNFGFLVAASMRSQGVIA